MPFFLWRMRCFYSYGIISISFWKHWFAPVQNSGAVYSVWASNLKTIALMREDSFLDCTAVIPYIIIRHFQTFVSHYSAFCLHWLIPFLCVFSFLFFSPLVVLDLCDHSESQPVPSGTTNPPAITVTVCLYFSSKAVLRSPITKYFTPELVCVSPSGRTNVAFRVNFETKV